MNEKIIAERTYVIVREVEQSICIQVLEPVKTLDEEFLCRIIVTSEEGVREYSVAYSEDQWGAVDAALRFCRNIISRIHDGQHTVLLNGKRSTIWI